MKVEIEQQDYINAIKPFRNGCAFKARFQSDGTVALEPGCYLLVNLVQGADRWFLDRWCDNKKQPFVVDVTPETKHEMMNVTPCPRCGGSLLGSAQAVQPAVGGSEPAQG